MAKLTEKKRIIEQLFNFIISSQNSKVYVRRPHAFLISKKATPKKQKIRITSF